MTDRNFLLVRVFRELRRRRVIRTAGFYIVGAWLLLQVADVLFTGWGLPGTALNALFVAAILGFPLALVFGWFFDVTTHGIMRTPAAQDKHSDVPLLLQRSDYLVLGALVLIGGFIVYEAWTEIAEIPRVAAMVETTGADLSTPDKLPNSIAVLPFTNISNDPDNEAFCDGISDEILNKLGAFAELNVIGRTSSFAFKNSDYRLPRISELLGTFYLLQGSVRKQGDRLRISAQLVDHTGAQIWSNTFDRALGDIFAIQAEIADLVAGTVVPQVTAQRQNAYEPPIAAYQHFLAGRELLRRRTGNGSEIRNQLQKAIDLDPRFAEAYAELAISYLIGIVEAEEAEKANEAIETALSLEPGMPRALAARGLLLQQQTDPDYAASEALLREVLAEDPNMVDALNWLSSALSTQEKHSEALAFMERAVRLDPLHGSIASNLAGKYAERGDFEAAERQLLRLLELPERSHGTYLTLRYLYWQTGRLVDMNAIEKRRALDVGFVHYGLAANYALLGLWEQASYWSERSKVDMPDFFWVQFYSANTPSWQGRYQEALDEMDKALEAGGKGLTELPSGVTLIYGDNQALAGDHEAAIRTLEPGLDRSHSVNYGQFAFYELDALHSLAWSYARVGTPEKARSMLESFDRQLHERQREGFLHKSDDLYFFAQNTVLMGNHDLALDRFEKAVASGWREYYIRQHDPRWAALKDNPRYQALMAEVKADVDRQRAVVERMDAEEDFPALLDTVRGVRQ